MFKSLKVLLFTEISAEEILIFLCSLSIFCYIIFLNNVPENKKLSIIQCNYSSYIGGQNR